MAILETAVISTIISQVLSMSIDLTERISDGKGVALVREIQKLMLDLQTRYGTLQSDYVELKIGLLNDHEEIAKLKSKLDKAMQEIDDHSQYEKAISQDGAIYLKHKTLSGLFACADCFAERSKMIPLQPNDPFGTGKTKSRICRSCEHIVNDL